VVHDPSEQLLAGGLRATAGQSLSAAPARWLYTLLTTYPCPAPGRAGSRD